jgi:hypothetical protein
LAERLLEIADREEWRAEDRPPLLEPDDVGRLHPTGHGSSPQDKKSRAAAQRRIANILEPAQAGRLELDMALDLTRDLEQWQTFHHAGTPVLTCDSTTTRTAGWVSRMYPFLIVEKDTFGADGAAHSDALADAVHVVVGYGSQIAR